MNFQVSYDDVATHLDWSHDSVTPKMIDWFWSNMEKAFILWHPEQHEALEWVLPQLYTLYKVVTDARRNPWHIVEDAAVAA